MRKLVIAALVAVSVATTAGIASAAVAEKCPDGYVGVVVDNHDVCTNIIRDIKVGG
ncbi:MAG TPA: hypothetical protein VGX28_15165 [Frankiaceae bacterium]|jgi:hypothetical protein|nr:hypothetical protein [Frankiaceae bacterium]